MLLAVVMPLQAQWHAFAGAALDGQIDLQALHCSSAQGDSLADSRSGDWVGDLERCGYCSLLVGQLQHSAALQLQLPDPPSGPVLRWQRSPDRPAVPSLRPEPRGPPSRHA